MMALEENGGWKDAPFTTDCNVGRLVRPQEPTAEIVVTDVYTRSPAAVPVPSAATAATYTRMPPISFPGGVHDKIKSKPAPIAVRGAIRCSPNSRVLFPLQGAPDPHPGTSA